MRAWLPCLSHRLRRLWKLGPAVLAMCVITLIAALTNVAAARERFTIVTTIAQIADPVKHIVGDRAKVRSLLGEGVDPHTYRLTRSDIAALADADVVFYNGFYLEAQMEDTLAQLAGSKPVIALAEQLPAEALSSSVAYPSQHDPHVWMDVALWAQVVAAACDALIDFNARGKSGFVANTSAYVDELERLQTYAEEGLATVPKTARVLVSAHDAFRYFGKAYGFEVIGIQGLSTESEAGLNRIETLVDLLVARDVGAVFFESSVSNRNVQALIDGAAAQGHTVRIGGQLFSDAMGAPGTYKGTYIGMLDHNITTIIRALGGEAPVHGLNRKLQEN